MTESQILIVDDKPMIREALSSLFMRHGYSAYSVESGAQALDFMRKNQPEVVFTDVCMPEMDGLVLLERLIAEYPETAVIMMTGHGTVERAMTAIEKGARDFLLKPFNVEEVVLKVDAITRLNGLLRRQKPIGRERPSGFEPIITEDKAMIDLFRKISVAAITDFNILIRGASGTGKELIAQAIHRHSLRKKEKLEALNCAAFTESLLDSELFGHEKGAFSDAHKLRVGRIEHANRGTVFLDEIGDISASMQMRLLRLLEQRELRRVGGNETIKVDIRVIAATHKNLEKMVAEGHFRADLYYRLNEIPLFVPALALRRGDVPLLVEHFIKKYNRLLKKAVQTISPAALEILREHSWPGNIRELDNAMKYAMTFSEREMLTEESFAPYLQGSGVDVHQTSDPDSSLAVRVNEFEKRLILESLAKHDYNRSHTAQALGLHRGTLLAKLKKHGIR